jgi:hypothetical protein
MPLLVKQVFYKHVRKHDQPGGELNKEYKKLEYTSVA